MIIKNRKKQSIFVRVDRAKKAQGLVFVMHGLGGFVGQPHMKMIVDVVKKKNYSVISFDTTNSFGESDGDYSDATVTNYLEDLEDVINWAKRNKYYQEPFILIGYSLGGLAVSLFAQKYPNMVSGLALFSTVVSGKLWKKIQNKQVLRDWKKNGVWIREENGLNSGILKIIKWKFAEDIMKYDLSKKVGKLIMPVLIIVGSNDLTTPASQQEIFFEKIPNKKELHVIDGAEHVFRDKKHLNMARFFLKEWLSSLNSF